MDEAPVSYAWALRLAQPAQGEPHFEVRMQPAPVPAPTPPDALPLGLGLLQFLLDDNQAWHYTADNKSWQWTRHV
jgi:hypothetical protein